MKNIRYSDLITTLRVILVSVFAGVISYEPELFKFIPGVLIIVFIFFTDTIDGIVARNLGESSKFGSFYDIVGDRVAEVVLTIPFVFLSIASPIVAIYFVAKGFVIDYIRFKKFVITQDVPFKQLNNPINNFLVASRFMRAAYGTSKMIMIFSFYAAIFYDYKELDVFIVVISVVTIVISSLRSIPSLWEYSYNQYFKGE